MRYFCLISAFVWLFSSSTVHADNYIELRDRLFSGTQYRVSGKGDWKPIGFLAVDLENALDGGPVEQKDRFNQARPLGVITAASLGVVAYTTFMNILLTGDDWSLTMVALAVGLPSNIFYRYELGGIIADYNSFSVATTQQQGVSFATSFHF